MGDDEFFLPQQDRDFWADDERYDRPQAFMETAKEVGRVAALYGCAGVVADRYPIMGLCTVIIIAGVRAGRFINWEYFGRLSDDAVDIQPEDNSIN